MKGKKMETESRNELGKVSLWAALAGVAGAATIALLFILLEALTEAEMPFSLCLLLFVGLEVIALVTGIVGWSCPYGKAGFGASLILLATTTFFIPVSRRVEYGQSTQAEPVMVIERMQSVPRGE
jgi:hypothetical protein